MSGKAGQEAMIAEAMIEDQVSLPGAYLTPRGPQIESEQSSLTGQPRRLLPKSVRVEIQKDKLRISERGAG
jgi:hypothetical protein